MDYIKAVFQAVLDGDSSATVAGVDTAIKASVSPSTIMTDGLIAAMTEVGQLFETGEYFVPEMLISARAMEAGLVLLKPFLVESGVKATGKFVIGTVKGDLHDIGKNLVGMMMEGAGFEVVDLGTDVTPLKFVEAVKQHQPDLVGLSALLTTTMPMMEEVVKALQDAGVRSSVKVMIGGAPITEAYAKQIGADAYASNAGTAARIAIALINP
jgi:5-methyltetrahydrofolate--homocysteine methyltransferase